MASKERGKYSVKEWAKINGGKGSPSSSTSTSGDLTGIMNQSVKASKDAADAQYTATALPSVLKDAYRQAGDPKLDQAISEKSNQVLGGAIEGLNKYKDIADPFQRRALAEKYQSGLSVGLDSLMSEKERRQGKLDEYITKWSGLYGAEAVRKQQQASIIGQQFQMQKTINDDAESKRRWEIENKRSAESHAKAMASGGKSDTFKDNDVIAMINEAKAGGRNWEQIAQTLGRAGVDVSKGSTADNELRRIHGLDPVKTIDTQYKPEKEKTQKQVFEEKKYENINAQIKSSQEEAKEGDLYWKGGKVFKKSSNWFGKSTDSEVKI